MLQIDNGKQPDDFHTACMSFWLPPNTPYGNLTLKLMKLIGRIDEANRRLAEVECFWAIAISPVLHPNAAERHHYAIEQAIYLMRRAADDLIALISCLSDWKAEGDYPKRIQVDCIGFLLAEKNAPKRLPLYDSHLSMLRLLNEISNAYKHSFVQTDINLIGRDEPVAYALALDYNKLESGVQFFDAPLSSMVGDFTQFYKDCFTWLEEFSTQHRPGATGH
ncbi:MAG: hypothetical protein QHC78_17370 [Pigmentiphaga sp.]|uniref:hypothetical protein n=1 Tax=Pigmentiphaga sp. TaxID=1977564 RepID=UPI0029AB7A22|nr:hypothetical protein [Pigmentiphaga sp.]MDX3907463.1 hypothetical protein [Pigmentiphaga sp.]